MLRRKAKRNQNSAILGKRQRFYLDQWVEEDYLEKSKQMHLFTPMRHWGDLLNNYSDNHDGFTESGCGTNSAPDSL